MRLWFLLVPAGLLTLGPSARSAEVRLPCIADTSVSSYESERDFNYGKSSRIRLKGIEMLALFRFGTDSVRSWNIESATLFLRYAGGERKLKTLGLSTISAPWEEGTGAGERKPGECCFDWAALGQRRWAGAQTDFTDVSFLPARSLTSYADSRDVGDGWIAVDVPPELVTAMKLGISSGLAVSDEKGQTRANNDVYSREQSGSEPYLLVRGAPAPAGAATEAAGCAAAPDPGNADFQHGAVRLRITPPKRAFAYRITYSPLGSSTVHAVDQSAVPYPTRAPGTAVLRGLLPFTLYRITVEVMDASGITAKSTSSTTSSAMKARPPALHPPAAPGGSAQDPPPGALRVWAYPDTAKAHPVSGNLLEEVGDSRYGGAPAGSYRRGNPVWDGHTVHLHAARNELVGFNMLIEAGAPPLRGATVQLPASLTPDAAQQRAWTPDITLYREWYVRDGEWFPEALLPLKAAFDVPSADNGVPGQRNQSLFVDLRIPRDLPPGSYSGSISVSAPGAPVVHVPLVVEVNRLALPDKLTFDVSLNTYGTVGGPFHISDSTAQYRALEQAYHRLAHENRATLAPVGYSHSGRITTNYAPPLEGEGAAIHVRDWTAWDAQFGPYLDGTAFRGLPRDRVPLSHMYLTFSESWPADIRKHYRYTQTVNEYPAMLVEHALKAKPIEQELDTVYSDEFKTILKEFALHFKQKGWTKTRFQIYFNDKHYYKDPKMGGQGTSWWLLDEPNHRDDWLALAYFGRLVKEALSFVPGAPILFREDISRPQWQRDYLDGLVDLMVVSGELFNKWPMLRDVKDSQHVQYWNYGSANPIKQTNMTAEAWAIRAWLGGADGIVPWQSIGDDENYEKPADTALILPGKRFGITGPISTLRLKALRRAEQDVEYLILYAKAGNWDREQASSAVSALLHLQGSFEQTSADDAGRLRFSALHAEDFAALRQAISATVK